MTILRKFERLDTRLRAKTRESRRHISTHNEVISVAKDRFLARMDANDIGMLGRFTEQVDFLQNHPEVLAMSAAVIQISEAGLKIEHIRCSLDHGSIEAQLLDGQDGQCAIVHPAVMMRAKAMAKLGMYRLKFRHA